MPQYGSTERSDRMTASVKEDLIRRSVALHRELETGIEVDPEILTYNEISSEAIDRLLYNDLHNVKEAS